MSEQARWMASLSQAFAASLPYGWNFSGMASFDGLTTAWIRDGDGKERTIEVPLVWPTPVEEVLDSLMVMVR